MNMRLEFLNWYSRLNKNKFAEVYAPHKPLTILFMLAKVFKNERWFIYNEDREALEELISKFTNKKSNCLQPVWRLKNDSKEKPLWKVSPDNLEENSSGDIKLGDAVSTQLKAGFSDEIYNWLQKNKFEAQYLIGEIIQDNFPDTLSDDLLMDLGIDLLVPEFCESTAVETTNIKAKRDPLFPKKVMQAYGFRCCVCKLLIMQRNSPLPMQAAHIKWKARGGICDETNGLSLCPTHHYTFDKGIWSIDESYKIILNQSIIIDHKTDTFFAPYQGKSILDALLDIKLKPKDLFLEWHRKNIFVDN